MAPTRGRKRSTPSSWKEESSTTATSKRVPESSSSQSGVPRLPPTKAARSSWKSRPVSAVVVLLPLVPVMATTGTCSRSRKASSTSPTTGIPARRAAAMPGSVSGTPGDTTTRSAEVKSRSSCPPSASEIASPSSEASVPASSAMVRRSVTVTRAPSRAASRAAAAPLRASPTTSTFFPASSSGTVLLLAKLQRHEGDQRQHDGSDPEAHDDLGLGEPGELEVVVDGGHPEDPPPGGAEGGHLHDHADRLDEEDAVQDGRDHLVLGEDGEHPQRAAQGQRAHVAHEHRGRVGVEPEEGDAGPGHGGAEDRHLLGAVHRRDSQVGGQAEAGDGGAGHVGEHQEGHRRDDGRPDGEPVEPVGEVDRVGGPHHHEEHEGDVGPAHVPVEATGGDEGEGHVGVEEGAHGQEG